MSKSPLSYITKGLLLRGLTLLSLLAIVSNMVDIALAYDIPTHFTMHDYFYALNSDFTLASETLNSNYDNKRTQDTHAFLHAESKRQHVCHSLHFLFSVSLFPILVLSQPNLVFYGRRACL